MPLAKTSGQAAAEFSTIPLWAARLHRTLRAHSHLIALGPAAPADGICKMADALPTLTAYVPVAFIALVWIGASVASIKFILLHG